MSFFSATTPICPEEEFDRERESLSDVERAKLHNDMYGDDDNDEAAIPETPTLLRTSLALLDEAIDALPEEEKLAYMLANESVPELIQDESPPLAFLRCESFDIWAAAKRLCGYWTFRLHLFGPDRAFLPMTLDGAMQPDLEDFKKYGILYPVDDDMHGRVVFYWDRPRASSVPREVVLRCCLYVVTKQQCSRPQFSLKGYVVIGNYQTANLRKDYDRALTKGMTEIVATTGGKLKAYHIFTGPGRSVAGLLLPVIRKIAGYYIRLRLVIHSGWGSDVLPYLEDYGLKESHVKLMYGQFADRIAIAQSWIVAQQRSERNGSTLKKVQSAATSS